MSEKARYNPFEQADSLHVEVEAMFGKSDVPEDFLEDAYTDDELRQQAQPAWLIPGWVPLVGVAGLWGEPGVGKTFVLNSMAKAVRRGKRWQHVSKPVRRRGAVAFFEGEVVTQLVDRQDAFDERWPLVNGHESPQLTIGRTPDLTTTEGVAAVVRTLERWREKLRAEDDDLVLVIFDPLPDFITGDENGEGLIRAVRALCWIAERLQVAIVVGHQSNAAGERARGNDVFRQKVFTYARLDRPEPDLMALVQSKNKFRPALALTLCMTPVSLPPSDDGEARESVILEYEEGGNEDLLAWEYERRREQRIAHARQKRRREQATDVHSDVERLIALAFKEQKRLTDEATFRSGSAVVAGVQRLDVGKGVSDASIRRVLNTMIGREVESEPGAEKNANVYRWIGD